MKKIFSLTLIVFVLISCKTKEIDAYYKVTFDNKGQKIDDELLHKLNDRVKIATDQIVLKKDETKIAYYFEQDFDTNLIHSVILASMNLEFWHTYKNTEVGNSLYEELNQVLSDSLYPGSISRFNELDSMSKTELSNEEELINFRELSPLSAYLYPYANAENQWMEGPILGYAKITDTAIINNYLKKEYVKARIPRAMKLMWEMTSSSSSEKGIPLLCLYLIKKTYSGISLLNENHVIKAKQGVDPYTKKPIITLTFNNEGAIIWANMTEQSATEESSIAMCLFGNVMSAPIASSRIEGGKTQITGGTFNDENGAKKVQSISTLINLGSLPKTLNLKSIEIIEKDGK